MRFFLAILLSFVGVLGAASADQTDTRLDGLFEELRTGDTIRAEETIDRILAIWARAESDTVNLLYDRAKQSLDAGEVELALALLDHVVGLAPNFSQGYALRGVVLLSMDETGRALDDFDSVLRLEPRQFEVRIALAEIMLSGGDKRGAYEMLQKALEWNPHEDHARQRARALRRELEGQEI